MQMDDDFSFSDNDYESLEVAILLDDDTEILQDRVIDLGDEEILDSLDFSEPSEEDVVHTESVVVSNFAERRQQKFRAQSKTKKQWTIITISVACAVAVVALLILESPLYNVDTITIKNTSTIPLSAAETARISKLAQVMNGQPMYRLHSDSAEKLIKDLPTITSVAIGQTWPNKVIVTISRREPVAYVQTNKGFVLVDNEGMAYEKTASAPKNLPAIEGLKEVTFTKKISNKNYVDIIAAAPQEIKNQIGHIAFKDKSYDVVLTDGIDIKLGSATQLKEKLAIAWSIILTKKRSELGYIDVSVPSLPVSGSPKLKV